MRQKKKKNARKVSNKLMGKDTLMESERKIRREI